MAACVATPALATTPVIHDIVINAFAFEPAHIVAKPGDILRWTNLDLAPHTATAEEFGWDTEELEKDESRQITVTTGMETRYFCAFHPHMKGTIEITA